MQAESELRNPNFAESELCGIQIKLTDVAVLKCNNMQIIQKIKFPERGQIGETSNCAFIWSCFVRVQRLKKRDM